MSCILHCNGKRSRSVGRLPLETFDPFSAVRSFVRSVHKTFLFLLRRMSVKELHSLARYSRVALGFNRRTKKSLKEKSTKNKKKQPLNSHSTTDWLVRYGNKEKRLS